MENQRGVRRVERAWSFSIRPYCAYNFVWAQSPGPLPIVLHAHRHRVSVTHNTCSVGKGSDSVPILLSQLLTKLDNDLRSGGGAVAGRALRFRGQKFGSACLPPPSQAEKRAITAGMTTLVVTKQSSRTPRHRMNPICWSAGEEPSSSAPKARNMMIPATEMTHLLAAQERASDGNWGGEGQGGAGGNECTRGDARRPGTRAFVHVRAEGAGGVRATRCSLAPSPPPRGPRGPCRSAPRPTATATGAGTERSLRGVYFILYT